MMIAAVAAVAVTLPATAAVAGHAKAVPAGAVWAWGRNKWGDLGDGTNLNKAIPVPVKLPVGTTITQVATGLNHTLALTSSGGVLAWGNNFQGELGDGTTTVSHLPVQTKIPAGVTVTAVTAGCYDSLALTSTGQLLAWGRNDYGELGDGTKIDRPLPVRVALPAGTKVVAVKAGCYFNLALTSTGEVLAWGRNDGGQLGNGNHTSSHVPIRVRLPKTVKIASIEPVLFRAGMEYGSAITSTGQVYIWQGLPVKMNIALPAGAGQLTTLAFGYDFTMALTSHGLVFAWGNNNDGQLGDGNMNGSAKPVQVKLPAGVKVSEIAAAVGTGYALSTTGHVFAWGQAIQGSLGTGQTTNTDIPVTVHLPSGLTATSFTANGELDPTDGQHAFAIVPSAG